MMSADSSVPPMGSSSFGAGRDDFFDGNVQAPGDAADGVGVREEFHGLVCELLPAGLGGDAAGVVGKFEVAAVASPVGDEGSEGFALGHGFRFLSLVLGLFADKELCAVAQLAFRLVGGGPVPDTH